MNTAVTVTGGIVLIQATERIEHQDLGGGRCQNHNMFFFIGQVQIYDCIAYNWKEYFNITMYNLLLW